MKCSRCGAEIPNGVRECPYCDAVIAEADNQTLSVYHKPAQVEVVSDAAEQTDVVGTSLTGKKYSFVSTYGTNLAGIFNSKITSDVEFAEDRLFIDIKPKRFNKSPAILFDDITGIDIARKINLYYWILIAVSVIGGFAAPYCFIFTVIFIFCGLQKKITISQRNGIKVVMYEGSGSQAEEFKEDMKKVARIQ